MMATCLNELLKLKLPQPSFWLKVHLFNWCLKLFFKRVGIVFNYASNQGWDTSALFYIQQGLGNEKWLGHPILIFD